MQVMPLPCPVRNAEPRGTLRPAGDGAAPCSKRISPIAAASDGVDRPIR